MSHYVTFVGDVTVFFVSVLHICDSGLGVSPGGFGPKSFKTRRKIVPT